ncbi:MAG: hypothetical protein Fur0036_14330 [Fimbriimonadaceae bacterium]
MGISNPSRFTDSTMSSPLGTFSSMSLIVIATVSVCTAAAMRASLAGTDLPDSSASAPGERNPSPGNVAVLGLTQYFYESFLKFPEI